MSWGASSSSVVLCPPVNTTHNTHITTTSSFLKLKPVTSYGGLKLLPRRTSFRCYSSSSPGGPGSGNNDSKRVLDAFFLGKALAEALSERIESAVGEILSTVGRLQAEQQKQVRDFEEEVFERAKRAEEKAAREAWEAQGRIPKTSPTSISRTPTTNSDTSKAEPSPTDASAVSSSPPSSSSESVDEDQNPTTSTDPPSVRSIN